MPTLIFIVGLLIFGYFYLKEKKNNEMGHARRTLKGFRDFPAFAFYFIGALATLFLVTLAAWLLIFAF